LLGSLCGATLFAAEQGDEKMKQQATAHNPDFKLFRITARNKNLHIQNFISKLYPALWREISYNYSMVLKNRPHVFLTGIGWTLHMLTATVSAQTGSMPKPFDPVGDKPKPPIQPVTDSPSSNGGQSNSGQTILQQQQFESVGPQSAGAADLNLGGSWPWESNTMTGDFLGARSKLQDAGVTLQGTATLDFVSVLNGGLVNGFSLLSLVDVNVTGDTEKLFGLKGGTLFVDFQTANQTRAPVELIPDYWGFDAINSYGEFTQLAQYWYQQEIIGDRLKVKFGKIDANVDFAVPCTGLNFIHSAAYYPAGLVKDMPTYPRQAGGLEILAKPMDNFDARIGFFDGSSNYANPSTRVNGRNTGTHGLAGFLWENPGSYFMIAELGPDWTIAEHTGKFRAGWFEQIGDTSTFGVNGPGVGTGPTGAYAYANQHVFDLDGSGKLLGLELFGEFSWSDPNQNPSHWGLMLGSQWQGLIDARPSDTVGVLWAYNQFSSNENVTTSPGSSEAILEAFYNVQVTPWFSIQPDMQYLSQPSSVSTSNIPGAWIFTMRLSFVF
jgi:porin